MSVAGLPFAAAPAPSSSASPSSPSPVSLLQIAITTSPAASAHPDGRQGGAGVAVSEVQFRPETLRAQGVAWYLASGASRKCQAVAAASLQGCPGGFRLDYDQYLQAAVSPAFVDPILREQLRTIRKDVDEGRSDPDNFRPTALEDIMWRVAEQRFGVHRAVDEPDATLRLRREFRAQLSRVLQAYVQRNRLPGYVQGMNYLACWLLCFLSEEQAFWVLCQIVEEIRPRDFFSMDVAPMHGFRCECEALSALLRDRLPALGLGILLADAAQLDLVVQLFASKALIPVFVNLLPPETLLVVWDMFLTGHEGFGSRGCGGAAHSIDGSNTGYFGSDIRHAKVADRNIGCGAALARSTGDGVNSKQHPAPPPPLAPVEPQLASTGLPVSSPHSSRDGIAGASGSSASVLAGGEVSLIRVCLAIWHVTLRKEFPEYPAAAMAADTPCTPAERPSPRNAPQPVDPLELYSALLGVCRRLTPMELTEALRDPVVATVADAQVHMALRVARIRSAWKWNGSLAVGGMLPPPSVPPGGPEGDSAPPSPDEDPHNHRSAESAFFNLNRSMRIPFGGELQSRWFARRFVRLFTGTPGVSAEHYAVVLARSASAKAGRTATASATGAASSRPAGSQKHRLSHQDSGPGQPRRAAGSPLQPSGGPGKRLSSLPEAGSGDCQSAPLSESCAPLLLSPAPLPPPPSWSGAVVSNSPPDAIGDRGSLAGAAAEGRSGSAPAFEAASVFGDLGGVPSVGMNRLQFHHFLHSLHHEARLGLWYRWAEFGRIFHVLDEDQTGLIDFKKLLFYLRMVFVGSFDDRLRFLFRVFDRYGLACLTLDALDDLEETILETVGQMHEAATWVRRHPARLFASPCNLPPATELDFSSDDPFWLSPEESAAATASGSVPGPPVTRPNRQPSVSPASAEGASEADLQSFRLASEAFERLSLEQAVRAVRGIFRHLREHDHGMLDYVTLRRTVGDSVVIRACLDSGEIVLKPVYEPCLARVEDLRQELCGLNNSGNNSSRRCNHSRWGRERACSRLLEPSGDEMQRGLGAGTNELEDDDDDERLEEEPVRQGRRAVDLSHPELCQIDLDRMLELAVDAGALPLLPLGPGPGEAQVLARVGLKRGRGSPQDLFSDGAGDCCGGGGSVSAATVPMVSSAASSSSWFARDPSAPKRERQLGHPSASRHLPIGKDEGPPQLSPAQSQQRGRRFSRPKCVIA